MRARRNSETDKGEHFAQADTGEGMAQRQEDLTNDELYRSYMRALQRYGRDPQESPSPGHVIRHCPNCGMRSMFRLDPEGTWYECLHCKHYA